MRRSTIRIGTRGSELALAQAGFIRDRLRQLNPQTRFEIVTIKTTGDRIEDAQRLRAAGKGVFVKELEIALKARRIDVAVHSLKDVPTTLPEGFALASVPERECAADAFVGRVTQSIDKVPTGGILGTASIRRQAMLKAHWPSLEIEDLRGNLDTRLEKLRAPRGRFAGIVVAAAGLRRLRGPDGIPHQLLPTHLIVPAAGQGALGLEIRSKDDEMRALLAPLHHEPTSQAVRAERELQRRLDAGCQVPLGAYAEVSDDGTLRLRGSIAMPDGSDVVDGEATGLSESPEEVAEALEAILRSRGGTEMLDAARPAPARGSSNGHKARRRARPARRKSR